MIALDSNQSKDELDESEFESESEDLGKLNLKAKANNFTL